MPNLSPSACANINIFLNLIQLCLLVGGIGGLIAALIPKTRKKKAFAIVGAVAVAVSFTIPHIINNLLGVTPHGPS